MSKDQAIIREQIIRLVDEYAAIHFASKPFEPGRAVIPPSGKLLGAEEMKNMVEAVLDGWLTTGRFNEEFERCLAKFLGVSHLITVNSGSSANLVAFSALTSPKLGQRAIMPGDEVIGVAAGFPTTVNPVIQYGAVPVFVDVELGTYNIDVEKLEASVGPKTKAVMLAHTLGNPYNLDVVIELCRKYRLWLIEDCCDALGSTYRDRMVGTFGDIGTLSFYPAHHITMGEGGRCSPTTKNWQGLPKASGIGDGIAIVHREKTIPAAAVFRSNLVTSRLVMTTSTHIATLGTILKSRTCRRPVGLPSLTGCRDSYSSGKRISRISMKSLPVAKIICFSPVRPIIRILHGSVFP